MKVREIMTPDARFVAPDSSLVEAASLMRSLDVGSLPIVQDGRLIGVLTDRDIVLRAVSDSRDLRTIKVREVMTDEVVSIFDDQEVTDAAELMELHKIRRLPVLDRGQHVVGVLSLGDIATESQPNVSGQVLKQVPDPAEPQR